MTILTVIPQQITQYDELDLVATSSFPVVLSLDHLGDGLLLI
jgi:hypothetical protein